MRPNEIVFVLWPPMDAAEQLAAVARVTATRFGGKPTLVKTIHLTLAFLGDVPEARLLLCGRRRKVSVLNRLCWI